MDKVKIQRLLDRARELADSGRFPNWREVAEALGDEGFADPVRNLGRDASVIELLDLRCEDARKKAIVEIIKAHGFQVELAEDEAPPRAFFATHPLQPGQSLMRKISAPWSTPQALIMCVLALTLGSRMLAADQTQPGLAKARSPEFLYVVADALLKAGLRRTKIEKISGGNFCRLFGR